MAKQTRVQEVIYNPSVSAEECGEDIVYANTGDFTIEEMPTTSVALKTEEQNKKTFSIPPFVLRAAVCWAILLLITGLRIHYTSVLSTKLRDEMEVSAALRVENQQLMEENQQLKRENQQLKMENQQLKRENQQLKMENQQLKGENQQLKGENQQLKGENQQLKMENQQLKGENQWLKSQCPTATEIPWTSSPYENYTANISVFHSRYKREVRIEEMQKRTRGLNESSAVWRDDGNLLVTMAATLPREPCQTSWLHFLSGCYSISDSLDGKTWEEARDDCRGKDADLVVVESPGEQGFIYNSSLEVDGFWIGLRVEESDWMWVNGSPLTEDFWILQPADDHHCAISVKEPGGWKAVSCDVKRGWICEKSALSV